MSTRAFKGDAYCAGLFGTAEAAIDAFGRFAAEARGIPINDVFAVVIERVQKLDRERPRLGLPPKRRLRSGDLWDRSWDISSIFRVYRIWVGARRSEPPPMDN
jgi:hypothetical protein